MSIFLNKQEEKPRVVGTGLITLDIVLNQNADVPTQVYAGGTCGNILTILGYLGWDAYPVARLNDEVASQKVKQDLEKWNIRMDFISLEPIADSPVIIQEIKKNSKGETYHKFSWTCPQCGTWLPPFKPVVSKAIREDIGNIPNPQVFFFDRVSRGALILAQQFRAQGAIIFFEPSGMNDLRLFKEALELSHIIKYAENRAATFKELISSFRSLIEIETLGSKGLRFRNSKKNNESSWIHMSPFETELVDAAGAGDWCSAGIIHSIGKLSVEKLNGISNDLLFEALKLGQVFASWTCGFEGARGGMYRVKKEELNTFVEQSLLHDKFFSISSKMSQKPYTTQGYSCPKCTKPIKVKSNSHVSV